MGKWIFLKNKLLNAVMAIMMLYFCSCGTILYPERRGQKAGRIDIGVAVMNAIGLFFFLVPGVIAFAVDFSNGTIYLPQGKEKSSFLEPIYNLDEMVVVKTGKEHLTEDNIEFIVKEYTKKSVDISSSDVIAIQFENSMAGAGCRRGDILAKTHLRNL